MENKKCYHCGCKGEIILVHNTTCPSLLKGSLYLCYMCNVLFIKSKTPEETREKLNKLRNTPTGTISKLRKLGEKDLDDAIDAIMRQNDEDRMIEYT